MILDPTLTAAYVVLAAAMAFSPGPDVMFVVANAMRHQVKGAVASALGICVGSLVHALAAALGVSAIIAASPLAFQIMKYLGAVYLAFLGIQALIAFFKKSDSKLELQTAQQISARQIFFRALITNLLNPKVIIFYLALLPQFVSVELGFVGLQIFLLGSIHAGIGLAFLVVVGLMAGRAAGWLQTTSAGRWLDGLAGVFFLGLAIRLALTGRAEG